MGAFRSVSYGVGGVLYRLVSSSNSQVSYQLIWKLTLLLLCLLLTTTTTSTPAKKKRRFDSIHYFTTIDGVIHDVSYGRSFDWFFLNLDNVDLHNIVFSITNLIIMIGDTRRLGIINEIIILDSIFLSKLSRILLMRTNPTIILP
jgi:hypothetical protein